MCGPGAQRRVGAVGAAVGACMVLMKVLPFVPGHFNGYEWLALGGWITSGLSSDDAEPKPLCHLEGKKKFPEF